MLTSPRSRRTPHQDRADMVAAPVILVAMLLLVISVLRPQMASAPMPFVILSLGACALLFVALLALYFERDRLGLDRWLLAGTAMLLIAIGFVYRLSLSPTLIATACGLPAAACIAAWIVLGSGRQGETASNSPT